MDNKTGKRRRGAANPQNLVSFNTETARLAQQKGVEARKLRKAFRENLLKDIILGVDMSKELSEAITTHDLDQITLLEKVYKMLGIDYASDPAVRQAIDIKAKTDTTVKATGLNITFTDAPEKKD